MRSISTLVKLLGIPAIAIALMLSITTGTATAAETARNVKTQGITAYPAWYYPTSEVQRSISLKEGYYKWQQIYYLSSSIPNIGAQRDDFYLGAGTYTWKDHLETENGYYIHTTTLDPDNPAWGTVTIRSNWFPAGFTQPWTWTWGSRLVPKFY